MKIVSENRFSGKTYFYTIAIRRSVNCELLVAEEEHENASSECKFCLAEENVAKVEKKVRREGISSWSTQ